MNVDRIFQLNLGTEQRINFQESHGIGKLYFCQWEKLQPIRLSFEYLYSHQTTIHKHDSLQNSEYFNSVTFNQLNNTSHQYILIIIHSLLYLKSGLNRFKTFYSCSSLIATLSQNCGCFNHGTNLSLYYSNIHIRASNGSIMGMEIFIIYIVTLKM